ncbi:MAG: hypothetical protein KIT22_08695 [Verrucomicrobiae bacterium]|nr:hypothetical protein [Verrucomicrobiae bacterium]
MSAAEVIEQIKQLSAPDKRAVYSFVTDELGPEANRTAAPTTGSEERGGLSFEEAQEHVFREHQNLLRRLAQ